MFRAPGDTGIRETEQSSGQVVDHPLAGGLRARLQEICMDSNDVVRAFDKRVLDPSFAPQDREDQRIQAAFCLAPLRLRALAPDPSPASSRHQRKRLRRITAQSDRQHRPGLRRFQRAQGRRAVAMRRQFGQHRA